MLPPHLKKYVVEQNYSRYSPVDQAVWRLIMKQLTHFLKDHAHPCYLEGLEKTGISIDEIPHIERMSAKLEKFGWRAVAVSGFIPPAAFMEMQALGFLPIAADLRSIDHMMYTPAPDIVHEAAGHAPILVDGEFAAYLKAYAQVARNAIISREDLAQYEAIRVLSDLKENPLSTQQEIADAERNLANVTKSISHISEAALLGRMNWWTAEYGLFGDIRAPKIFGAGLLSSAGEAKACLDAKVKKLPLTIDCIHYSYDITEPQPQLFVTPNFERLMIVLNELASMMAFQTGGVAGLEKAVQAQTVNTVELDSGLQIAGCLQSYRLNANSASQEAAYLHFSGPCQLAVGRAQVFEQGRDVHPHGYGCPVGQLDGDRSVEQVLANAQPAAKVEFNYQSGVRVRGTFINSIHDAAKKAVLIVRLSDCRVTIGDDVLFQPEWGIYDMAVGRSIKSVYSGPADRAAYGEAEDFVRKTVQPRQYTENEKALHALYLRLSTARREQTRDQWPNIIDVVSHDLSRLAQDEWLLRLELVEMAKQVDAKLAERELKILHAMAVRNPEIRNRIAESLL